MESEWLFERCREVQAAPDGYLDLWAREHYKSTIITFGQTIRDVLNDPEITVGIFSHTRPIAKGFLRQIKREFESNKLLQAIFPDILWAEPQKEAPKWSEDDGIVVKRKGNPKESTVEAWGLVDGQPTSKHFRLRVYDDVVTKESVTTPEMVLKTTEAWGLSENLGVAGGQRRYIGTRYSFADTYEEMMKRGIKPRIYPATDDGTTEGKPIFWSQEIWEEKKLIQGPANTACQLLQNPIAGQQAMFNVKDLEVFEVRPRTLNIYIMVDPARSMKKGSANTAMAVVGIDAGKNKYLLDGYNHRMDLKTRWEKLKDLYRIWTHEPGVQQVFVGYEAYGAQADLDYFVEQQQKPNETQFAIEELKWPRDGEGSKDDRVQRLGPDIRSHKFYLPYQGPETANQAKMKAQNEPYRLAKPIKQLDSDKNMYDLSEQFKQQVMFYPFCALKDLIDATSRIYDMDPMPPMIINPDNLVPEVFPDGI